MTPPPPTPRPATNTTPVSDETGLALLTVEQAAQRLSIGRTTMYALLKADHINSLRIGRLRRIPAQAITEYTNRLTADQQTV